jgi:ferredoxin-type protein NapH
MAEFRKYKFLLMRRTTQIGTMLLFIGGSMFGWHFLRGNLSTSKVFDAVTLTDPYAILQIVSTGRIVRPRLSSVA